MKRVEVGRKNPDLGRGCSGGGTIPIWEQEHEDLC